MSSSTSKPNKNQRKSKPTLAVISKKDKQSESNQGIMISPNSKKQPDYSKVKTAIAAVLQWVQDQKMPITPWHIKEFTRVTDAMAAANDPIVVYIVSQLEKSKEENKAEEAYMSIDVFVRPENSFLHKDSPCPSAFMQRNALFIDKINANIDEHKNDPNFWWQPVTNVMAYSVAQAISKLGEACTLGLGVDFGGLTNNTQVK